MQMGRRSHQPCSCSVLRGSCPCEPRVDLRRREAMHRRSARARRIYACRSSRKKRPHRSALCIRSRPCRWVSGRLNVLMLGVAMKLTLRALGGSNTPSRRSRRSRRSARARRIYACSSSRKKRPHRSALCTAAVRLSHLSALGFFVGPKRNKMVLNKYTF